MPKITPFLWFDGNAEEAAKFYVSVFKPGKLGKISRYLLEQRSALRKQEFSFDSPPPRGGFRSLSAGADCIATQSRALPGLLY